MSVVLLALLLFDLGLEEFEEYLHHHKRRFHKRLFDKVLGSTLLCCCVAVFCCVLLCNAMLCYVMLCSLFCSVCFGCTLARYLLNFVWYACCTYMYGETAVCPRVCSLDVVAPSLYCVCARRVLQAIKECMILGFISFVLFILKDQAVVEASDEVFANTFDVRWDKWMMTLRHEFSSWTVLLHFFFFCIWWTQTGGSFFRNPFFFFPLNHINFSRGNCHGCWFVAMVRVCNASIE